MHVLVEKRRAYLQEPIRQCLAITLSLRMSVQKVNRSESSQLLVGLLWPSGNFNCDWPLSWFIFSWTVELDRHRWVQDGLFSSCVFLIPSIRCVSYTAPRGPVWVVHSRTPDGKQQHLQVVALAYCNKVETRKDKPNTKRGPLQTITYTHTPKRHSKHDECAAWDEPARRLLSASH